jgi:recombinational DNA repair ATPase RecF
MLTKLTLANFKSYREATLDLSPLTLLIGANVSGKSNALEAMQMLSWLSRGRRLDEVFQAVQESESLMRGTVADLAFGGTGNCVLGWHGSPLWGDQAGRRGPFKEATR